MHHWQTLVIFYQKIKRHRILTAVLVVSAISIPIFQIIPSIYYRKFFDILTEPISDTVAQNLLTTLLIIIGLHSVSWGLYRVFFHTIAYWQPKIMAELTADCYAYVMRHSLEFFSNNFVGSLVRKIQRFSRTFEVITDKFLFDIIRLIVGIPTMIVFLWLVNPTVSLVVIVWVVIYVVGHLLFVRWKIKYDIRKAALDSKATGILADGLTNHVSVTTFVSHDREERLLNRALESVRRLRTFTWNLNMGLEAVQGVLMIFLEFLLFFLAIKFWRVGEATVGDFVLIQYIFLTLFENVWNMGRVLRELYEALADASEMVEILEEPQGIKDVKKARRLKVATGAVSFHTVSFSYRMTRKVLRDFNLEIAPGEKVALVGPSGAGKSTVIKLLLRFYDPDSGRINIDGQNIAKVSQESLRRQMSYVPQDPVLFHRTLMENIRYARPAASEAEVIQAAKTAHCHGFIKNLPDGYGTYVGERGVKLSGGERQRVAIARAILKNAPLLILDEATSSLDSESEYLIQDALAKLMVGKTVIVIAHRLSTIMKMDRIVEMQNGQVTDSGTHAELLSRRGGMYRQLWQIQAGGFKA